MKIYKYSFYPFVAFVLILIVDYLQNYFHGVNSIYSLIIKGFIFAGFLINTDKKLITKPVLIISLFFFISQLSLYEKITIKDEIYNIKYFILYLFVFVLYGSLPYYIKKIKYQIINKSFIVVLSIVFISVWIGFFTNNILLKTYDIRWGFKGVIGKSSTLSYFFIGSLSYVYFLFIKKRIKSYFFIFSIATSLLTGTKTIYLFLIVLIFYHIYKRELYFKPIFWYGVLSIVVLFYLNFNLLLLHTSFLWEGFYTLYLEKGFLYSLSSFRTQMLLDGTSSYFKNWSLLNLLIGGRIPRLHLFEMSFFDLISFFGFVGAFYYIKTLISLFKDSINIFPYTFSTFVFLSYFFYSFLLGQFFISSSAIFFSWFFILLIILNEQKYKHT